MYVCMYVKIFTLVLPNLSKELKIYTIPSKVKNSSPFSEWLKIYQLSCDVDGMSSLSFRVSSICPSPLHFFLAQWFLSWGNHFFFSYSVAFCILLKSRSRYCSRKFAFKWPHVSLSDILYQTIFCSITVSFLCDVFPYSYL